MKKYLIIFTLLAVIPLNVNAEIISVDSTFNTGTSFNGTVNATAIQTDGKVIVGGSFNNYNGQPVRNLTRLTATGVLDSTFTATNMLDEGTVNSISIQPDGKVVIGGIFAMYGTSTISRVARLNTDGTLDTTFNADSFTYSTVSGYVGIVDVVRIAPDGKFLVSGSFTEYGGSNRNFIVRLNSNGTIDNSFIIGTGFNGVPTDIMFDSNGAMLIVGTFEEYDGTTARGIVRLNSDGSINSGFDSGEGFNGFTYDAAIQSDGKILVSGMFTEYDGILVNNLVRLNSNGTFDTTFGQPGSGFNNLVLEILPLSTGKVLVGGAFTEFNSSSTRAIARLNSNGTLDTTFEIGDGFTYIDENPGQINQLVVQSNGKIIAAGSFSRYNTSPADNIIRLNTTIATPPVDTTTPKEINKKKPIRDIIKKLIKRINVKEKRNK